MPGRVGSDGDGGGGWFDRLVSSALGVAALVVDVRAPPSIPLGERTAFHVVVKNRLPVPVTVSTPTSRIWGWEVDGVHEADERSFSPPETGRTIRFGGFERKVFEARWDGRIRRPDASGTGTVWDDATGTRTITGYFAVENWESKGLYAEADVEVREAAGHQE